jgi:hypothetical protein
MDEGESMIRRDILLDPDRPRYYSQFWVDVASGKHTVVAGASAAGTDVEDAVDLAADLDLDEAPEAIAAIAVPEVIAAPEVIEVIEPPMPVRPEPKKAEPKKTDSKKAEPKKAEPITSLADLAKIDMMMKSSAEMDSDTIPDLTGAVAAPGTVDIVTDFDLNAVEPEAEEPPDGVDAEFAGDDYDEEDDWGEGENEPRRGSKPNKRRDTRRDSREPRRDF